MIKQAVRKTAKIGYGFYNSYIRKKGHNYKDSEWWDSDFYVNGVSDRQTIGPNKGVTAAKYHYASVELKILRHFVNHEFPIDGSRVLDIGSGAGHWIDFYRSLGARGVDGLDVSDSSFRYLSDKYASDSSIDIHHGGAIEVMKSLSSDFDVVNAVGVMFHIVDDSEWEDTITEIGRRLRSGGKFVVGGHFGLIDGLNVQIDRAGNINKRLRSIWRWKNTLQQAGFSKVNRYQNNAHLWVKEPLPENSVLVATK